MAAAQYCYVDACGGDPDFAGRLIAQDICRDVAEIDRAQRADCLLLQFNGRDWAFRLPREKTRAAVTFQSGDLPRRLQSGGLGREAVVRAVRGRLPATRALSVLDATAGFARDAMLLAAAGCDVQLSERWPLLALLLANAIERARGGELAALRSAARRCELMDPGGSDSVALMQGWQGTRPDVVYLDPMYAGSDGGRGLKTSAMVNKQVRTLQLLDSLYSARLQCGDASALLAAARRLARSRVVVKRPPAAAALAGIEPASSIRSKAVRFDVYPV